MWISNEVPGMLMLWETLKPLLCSMLSFTSVDGACKVLIEHQIVGNFTVDVDEFDLGGNSL